MPRRAIPLWKCSTFYSTIEECRELGARGGRIRARNLRLRKAKMQNQPDADVVPPPPQETVYEASLLLDAQFPRLAASFLATPPPKAQLGLLTKAVNQQRKFDRLCGEPEILVEISLPAG